MLISKSPFLLFFLFLAGLSRAFAQDTVRVVTHDKTIVVTDPSKGYNSYHRWGVFPSADTPIRKIIMHVKFACPDTMRCADWDYLDHITIKRTGGVKGTVKDFEIGRMLTPYGGSFKEDWKFDWQVDVTDFSLLLRDSVEIEYKHTGYEPNDDRGWKVTVAFEIIKGEPIYEPVSIQKIYEGFYAYGDSSKPINAALAPVEFIASDQATIGRLRILQTGHGMDEPDGCGEFCNKYREFWFDHQLVDRKAIWKECGDNPLYPQAGTWIFDRANWCPGYLMQPVAYEIPLKSGQQHTAQLRMENYTSPEPSARELISAYLIQYKPYNNMNDAAMQDIIIPSGKKIYRRVNPACFNPQIVIKNNGGNKLREVLIQYGNKGLPKGKFKWEGALLPGETDTVALQGIIPSEKDINIFSVALLQPNGKKDAYPKDNMMSSTYPGSPVHEGELIFFLQTNNRPEENGYSVVDSNGKVIYGRPVGSLEADKVYRDTLNLPPGCYQLQLIDTAGNGLEFWYHVKAGRGRAHLLNSEGKIVKSFRSDFGNGITYNFRVGRVPDPVASDKVALGLFPTRTNDTITFDFISNAPEKVKVQLVRDPGGEIVEEHIYEKLNEAVFSYDLSRYVKARFYFKVYVNGELIFNKRVRLKE